jgi:hypothetical protein
MKKDDVIVNEYVRKLSDEDLSLLGRKFKQRLSGDMADIAVILSKDSGIDKWLLGATSGSEWFDMVEKIDSFVRGEVDRRFGKRES